MTADWLIPLTPAAASPRLRLLCLPFAGGGPSAFRSWRSALPAGIELLAAQLPGRERRIAEPPCRDLDTIVDGLRAAVLTLAEAPLALFGQSLGGALAHDLAVALTQAGHRPAVVAVAARRAPHLSHRRQLLHRLSDDALIAAIADMGGTPTEVLDNADLMTLMLPTLRADILLSETFSRPARPVLSCPLLALAGEDDPFAPPADVQLWHLFSTGRFRFERLSGGHFFPTRHRDAIVTMVLAEAAAGMAQERAPS